jgi:hypothetical protein
MAAYKDVYAAQYAGCTLVRKSILPYYLIQPADVSESELNGAKFRRLVAAVALDFQDLHLRVLPDAMCVSFKKMDAAPDMNECSLGFTCAPESLYSVTVFTFCGKPIVLNGDVAYLSMFESFSSNASTILKFDGFDPLHVKIVKKRSIPMKLALGDPLSSSDLNTISAELAARKMQLKQFDLQNAVHRGVLLTLITESRATVAACLTACAKT